MDKHPIGEVMGTTMDKLKEMVDVNTIVGDAITTPDGTTLIPVSRVSFGFGSGGSDFPVKDTQKGFGGGNGAAIKIDPVGFVVIKDGSVRFLNIAPPAGTTVDRLVEIIPDAVDKVTDFIDKRKD